MVVGTISHKQAPILVKIYNQMTEPKWVVAYGVCTVSGGFYDNYSTVMGIDTIIPVDVYIPGCPPRPEMVIDALIKLQGKVQTKLWKTTSKAPALVTPAENYKGLFAKKQTEILVFGRAFRRGFFRVRLKALFLCLQSTDGPLLFPQPSSVRNQTSFQLPLTFFPRRL